MLSNIMIEIPWQSLAGLFLFVLWYYPIGLYRNAEPTNTVHERGALTFILMQEFMWFVSGSNVSFMADRSDVNVCTHDRGWYSLSRDSRQHCVTAFLSLPDFLRVSLLFAIEVRS